MAYINGKEILFSLNGNYVNYKEYKDKNDFLKSIVDRTIKGEVIIPSGFNVGGSAFHSCSKMTKLIVPADAGSIGAYGFQSCSGLTEVDWYQAYSVGGAFYKCTALKTVRFHNRFQWRGNDCFAACTALENLIIDKTCGLINNTSCNLTACPLTVESLLNLLNALEDNTGNTQYTAKLGATNLAKLTAEQQQIATNKNIALA